MKSKLRILPVIASVLIILLIAADIAVVKLSNVIGQSLQVVKTDKSTVEQAEQQSKDICQELEEEGIVLLKNTNNTLPLIDDKNINVFGFSSIKLIYGGAGSGASDERKNITLVDALKSQGFNLNTSIQDFYSSKQGKESSTNIFNLKGGDYNIQEVNISEYPSSLLDSAKAFSDTALIVFSRSGGEGGDLPFDMESYQNGDKNTHYLKLQNVEQKLLDYVCANYNKVIVLINSSNAMELGFVNQDNIQAALWVGGPGSTGCNAIAKVLSGKTNPSGRLTDTYAYDLSKYPAYYTAGNFYYTDNGKKTTNKYVNYNEGIYVGYRYYETRFVDEQGECNQELYNKAVQYPFGYGLSYTTFDKVIEKHWTEGDKVYVQVKVTNTGNISGKEVIQLYYTPPYYDGGIQKSHVTLAAFDKTEMLEPGSSQTVTLSFDVSDMASYDYINNKAYVLEKGKYTIKLMENSHQVIDCFDYNIPETVRYFDDVTNVFDAAAGNLTYIDRSNWEDTIDLTRYPSQDAESGILEELNKDNINKLYCSADPKIDMPATGVNKGVLLEDMINVSYDDKKWDEFIQQLTIDDMKKLIGFGGFGTVALESIGKVTTIDIDGPAGLNALISSISGVQFPSEVVIASTFNTKLAKRMGEVYADEAISKGVNGLYAPAVNIHRTPFSGRNFEYYSEDPFVSGVIGTSVCQGIRSKGVNTYVKHFALNDQETNRSGIAVWSNEQAIREIYLKPFQMIVKENATTGLMSSYNRIGTIWAGGNKNLLTDVLRNEWGFNGVVVTDYDNAKYMNTDQALRAGGDLMLTTTGDLPTEVTTNSPYGVMCMQRASKNILYSVVNSIAYQKPVQMGKAWWKVLVVVANVLIGLLCAALIIIDRKKSVQKYNK